MARWELWMTQWAFVDGTLRYEDGTLANAQRLLVQRPVQHHIAFSLHWIRHVWVMVSMGHTTDIK